VSYVLVVDDDPNVADVVTRYLARDGFRVESVADGRDAVTRVCEELPDLVVLDLMLPGLDGFEVYRRIRRLAPIPVIMLTGRGREDDRVAGLELGADDYIAKPFSPRELTARVKSVLRRAHGALTPLAPAQGGLRLRAGRFELDPSSRHAWVNNDLVTFTAREFELVTFLMTHPGVAFRRQELLEHVWGWTYGDSATVTVHVRRIREKIESDPSHPELIATVWGVGYRFAAAVESGSRT